MSASAEDIKQIESFIEQVAMDNGYELTDNYTKIAKAKANFFGLEQWRKCCCVRDDEHYCMSPACRRDVEEKGICDCRLYKKGEKI